MNLKSQRKIVRLAALVGVGVLLLFFGLALARAWNWLPWRETAPAPRGFLQADGTVLRNDAGQVVQLRGVNLGGWLEWQAWMCPMDSSRTLRDANPGHNGYNFEVRNLLSQRFGPERAEQLIAAYLDHWISLADLDEIQSLGLNAVRLTLAYDTFLDADGSWRSNAFQRVDWLVNNAWLRGIYTILDFHAFLPPGADQDGSAHGYWSDATQKEETVQIWQRIAAHYRDNPAVAMYDLLNEPNNSAPKGRSQPSAGMICELYDRLYHAIRTVDTNHIIALEGVWDWTTLRDPIASGYSNVVYSFHWYHWQGKTTEEQRQFTEDNLRQISAMWKKWRVPVFIGEFNFFGDRIAWEHGLNAFNQAGLSWAIWTYKNKLEGNNSWGLMTTVSGQTPPVPDLAADAGEVIQAKWQAWQTSTQSFALNPMLKSVMLDSAFRRTNNLAQSTP